MMAPEKEDCICPICMCIFIEPVTMPCKHSLCMPCYRQTVDKANLCCPICRLRISVWARRATKMDLLVDKVKWDAVKKAFPEQVQNRIEGKESQEDVMDDVDDYETQQRRLKELSKPGEIRQEYEAALQKLQSQLEEQAKEEEEASAALIKTLQQEEEKEKETLDRQREELDRIDREVAEVLQESLVADAEWVTLPESETLVKPLPSVVNKAEFKAVANGIKKGKNKQSKQLISNNLTLMTFFGPVSRVGGSTLSSSDFKYPKDLNQIDNDSCSSESSNSFYTSCSDNYSQSISSHASTSHEISDCVLEIHRGTKHSDKTFSNPTQTTFTSELKKHETEISNSKQQNHEDEDRFFECLSNLTCCTERVETYDTLATSCTGRVETLNNHASISDAITCPLDITVNAESAHMTSHFQPIVKCKRISLQQSPKEFSICPPIVTTETEKSAANNVLNPSTTAHPSICSYSRSDQISYPDIGDKIKHPIQDLYLNASSMRHKHNVCDNSSQNSFIVSTESGTARSKVGKMSQDSNCEHHQTLQEAPVLKPKLNSDNRERVMFIESINESLKSFTNVTPTIKPVTGKDGYSLKFNNDFPDKNEMKENDNTQNEEQKSNNTEKGIMESNNYENERNLNNNYEKREMERNNCKKGKITSANFEKEKFDIITIKKKNNKNDRMESSVHEKEKMKSSNSEMEIMESFNSITDLSVHDSCQLNVIKYCDNDIDITCGDSNSCYNSAKNYVASPGDSSANNYVASPGDNISSQLFPNSVDKCESIAGASFSGVGATCIVEKLGRGVTLGSTQQKIMSTTSKTIGKKDLVTLAKNSKNKNINHRTRKSKKSKSLLKVGNKALHISIDHWCVYKNKDEKERGLKPDGDFLVDKTEIHDTKSHKICNDENKDIVKERIQTLEHYKGKRKNVSDIQDDTSVSVPKKLRTEGHTDQSGLGAGALDASCPRNFEQDEMSQEQKDHQLALSLQKMYAQLDKQKITVDRFKGSKDQYLLRKNRK